MLRFTFQDRVYTVLPDDNTVTPVAFAPRDASAWVTVLDQAGLRIDVLSGGTKSAFQPVTAPPAPKGAQTLQAH